MSSLLPVTLAGGGGTEKIIHIGTHPEHTSGNLFWFVFMFTLWTVTV